MSKLGKRLANRLSSIGSLIGIESLSMIRRIQSQMNKNKAYGKKKVIL